MKNFISSILALGLMSSVAFAESPLNTDDIDFNKGGVSSKISSFQEPNLNSGYYFTISKKYADGRVVKSKVGPFESFEKAAVEQNQELLRSDRENDLDLYTYTSLVSPVFVDASKPKYETKEVY